MVWIVLTVCSYYALQSTSYVLLAANIDDFSKIAKSFDPAQITSEIEAAKGTDEDSRNAGDTKTTNLNKDATERAAEYSIEVKRRREDSYRGGNMHYRNKKTVSPSVFEMNLDDLVERVKEKLRDELTQMVTSDQNPANIKAPSKENSDDYDNIYEPAKTIKKTKQIVIKQTKPEKRKPVTEESDEYEPETKQTKRIQLSRTTTERRIKQIKRKPVKNKVKTANNNEEFQAFSLTGGNDSYDEYVTPKKDEEDYDNDPTEYVREGKETTEYIKEKFYTEAKELREKEDYQEANVKDKIRQSPNILSLIMSTEPDVKDDLMIDNPPLSYAEQLAGTPDAPVEEYEDETTTINIGLIGYRTENIMSDSDQEMAEEKPKFEPKGKKTKPTRNTIIPKRDFYKLSTPNILAKLPKIAEKYKFDEPLPEQDREPEVLRNVGNPPASINGKEALMV